jgi:ABC-type dipeptide/oligopeptide/nickel transport system permease component
MLQVLRFDFGASLMSERPVTEEILARFPLTLTLALMGLGISVLIAVPLGVVSAVRRWSVWDYLGMAVSHAGMALPSFWLGILLLLVFAVRFPLFPLFGAGGIGHLFLPALSLGLARAAILIRLIRASMLEELQREYVVTARAKGLTEATVRYRHALRNALLPVVTVAGIQLGYMLGGAIVIEQVFGLPGLGRLFLSAIYQRDFPLVQGGVVFVALVFSLINFTVDVLYGALNPRIEVR